MWGRSCAIGPSVECEEGAAPLGQALNVRKEVRHWAKRWMWGRSCAIGPSVECEEGGAPLGQALNVRKEVRHWAKRWMWLKSSDLVARYGKTRTQHQATPRRTTAFLCSGQTGSTNSSRHCGYLRSRSEISASEAIADMFAKLIVKYLWAISNRFCRPWQLAQVRGNAIHLTRVSYFYPLPNVPADMHAKLGMRMNLGIRFLGYLFGVSSSSAFSHFLWHSYC